MSSHAPTELLLVRCPRCKGTLAPLQLQEAGASALAAECTSCHGHWLEAGDLESAESDALAHVEIHLASATESRRAAMGCPKCSGFSMLQVASRAPSVLVEVCPRCHGSWLDGTELGAAQVKGALSNLVGAYRFVRESE